MSKVESTERADSPTLWHDIIPSVGTLRPRHSAIRVAPGDQPVELTSPETTLDTALALIPHLRDERSTLRTLFPLLPVDIEIIIPSPAAKSENAAPPAPTVVPLGDVADLSPSKASSASGVPNARLLGALVQSAILHGVPQPTPQSIYARRITGWLHGLAPLEAYLLHQAILGNRVPRALRVQTSGLGGLSRAEQLRSSFGALLAADAELAPLFDVIYNELNPLSSRARSTHRVPELSEELLAGVHWGLPREYRIALGRLVGALHPEFDAADGWLLISKAKKGAPRERWTVASLRETQRSMLQQLLRTGSTAPEELREQLAKARVPLPHGDDVEAWREFCGLEVVDGTMRVLEDPSDEKTVNENRAMVVSAFGRDRDNVLKANAPVLGTSVFPPSAAPDEATSEQIRRAAASPLAASFGEDTFSSLQEISMLTGVDFDSIMAELGHGTEPLEALESLGIPAGSLLGELDELLTGPRSAQKAILMLWAVNRARGGGGAPAHFSEAKYELTGAMLRHPATFADPDPAESWRLVLGSSWWHSPRWEEEFPGHTPSTDEVRRFNYIAELGENVHRAMESATFRAQADAHIAATLAQAPAQDVSSAVIRKTSERTAARLGSEEATDMPKTLLEWEHMLTSRLEGATLIIDADLRPDELTTLSAELGARVGDLPADPQTYADFVKRYPAATLTTVVGIASLNAYKGLYIADDPMRNVYHGLVPTIAEALGLFESEDTPGAYGMMQAGLEAEFAQALRDLDLAEFVDLHTHHLADLIVAHAGLPVSAMGKIVDALTAFTTSVPDRTMHHVYPWLMDPSQREFFGTLPTGTQLLFQQAPALSARMLNQAVDLVEAYPRTDPTHDGGESDPGDSALAAHVDVAALPTMIREGLLDALRAQATEPDTAPTRTTASRRAADRMQRPYLWLDGTDAVCVALPPVSKCADEPWIVSTGDDVTPVRPRRSLRDDETQTSLLRKPARRVAVIHPSFHTTVELRLFTTDFPVALFLPDGRQIPTSAMVPQGEVFALVPPGHEPTSDSSGAPQVLETLDTPEGWGQWTLQLWNLDGLDKVVVLDAAGVAHEIRVGSHELPALWDTEDEPIEALTGVESEDGLPVLAARPWIDVPPLPAGTRPWTVRIRRSGTAEWHTVGTYCPESEHEGYPLFDEAVLSFFGLSESEPILGGFDIRVDGPEHARVDLRRPGACGFRSPPAPARRRSSSAHRACVSACRARAWRPHGPTSASPALRSISSIRRLSSETRTRRCASRCSSSTTTAAPPNAPISIAIWTAPSASTPAVSPSAPASYAAASFGRRSSILTPKEPDTSSGRFRSCASTRSPSRTSRSTERISGSRAPRRSTTSCAGSGSSNGRGFPRSRCRSPTPSPLSPPPFPAPADSAWMWRWKIRGIRSPPALSPTAARRPCKPRRAFPIRASACSRSSSQAVAPRVSCRTGCPSRGTRGPCSRRTCTPLPTARSASSSPNTCGRRRAPSSSGSIARCCRRRRSLPRSSRRAWSTSRSGRPPRWAIPGSVPPPVRGDRYPSRGAPARHGSTCSSPSPPSSSSLARAGRWSPATCERSAATRCSTFSRSARIRCRIRCASVFPRSRPRWIRRCAACCCPVRPSRARFSTHPRAGRGCCRCCAPSSPSTPDTCATSSSGCSESTSLCAASACCIA